jgi:periplasmic divalent cation tolerance protein
MENDSVVVMITAPNREVARQIGLMLVERKLAACANLVAPIESIYAWKGQIQQEEEVLIILKTRLALVESQIIPAVQEIHPYEVPEIIALPIQAGLPAYLQWIMENTQGG